MGLQLVKNPKTGAWEYDRAKRDIGIAPEFGVRDGVAIPERSLAGSNITPAEYERIKSQAADLQRQIDELTAVNTTVNETGARDQHWSPEDAAKYDMLYNQLTALQSYIALYDAYTKDYEGREFGELPTLEAVQGVIKGTDPRIAKYISTKGFDVERAVADGLDDSVLVQLGYAQTDVDTLKSLAKIKAVLPGGVEGYDSINLALQAGLREDLLKIGVTQKDIDNAVIMQRLIDEGFYDSATGQIRVTEAVSKALELNRGDILDNLTAFGVSQGDITQAAEWAGFVKKLKLENPELYEVLETKGVDAFNTAVADYNAAIEKQNAEAKATYDKQLADIVNNLDPTSRQVYETNLRTMGDPAKALETVNEYNQVKFVQDIGGYRNSLTPEQLKIFDDAFAKTQNYQAAFDAVSNYTKTIAQGAEIMLADFKYSAEGKCDVDTGT